MDFGELRIESSRAFWDDYDEEGDEREEFPTLEWKWQNEDNTPTFPTELDTFLLVEGHTIHVLDFFNTILLKNRPPVAQLSVGQASVYEFPDHKLAVAVVDEKDLNYFTPITQQLEPWIKASKSVFALTFNSAASFRGEEVRESVDGCFVRGINSPFAYVKELEVPNIVSGVSAGVVSLCKHQKAPASCFVVYMEAPLFDSITSKPIIRLLKEMKVPCDDAYSLKHVGSSNLYL